jgi:hypothetical protein
MSTVNKLILTFLTTAITIMSFGQAIKTLKPSIGAPINYSKQEQLLWQKVMDKESKTGYEKLSSTEKSLIDSIEMGVGPITDFGCSWYCGGRVDKVTSDSWLKETGSNNYKPDNIHDFNLLTAWIPDTTNGVIGKKISFHFEPLSPRVNEILIYNGYIKNYDLFKANSRVKKFQFYIDGRYYATLDLADTTAQQSFKIPPTQSKDKNTDLILTFEITEIYKGDKYLDVAVSEINFNGLVH